VFHAKVRYPTLVALPDAVKIGIGHYDLATLPGKMTLRIAKPHPISLARMYQQSLTELYDRAAK
jgi:hypothetical protein